MNKTGDRVRERRVKLGITQVELSAQLSEIGVKYGQAHLSRLERGWNSPGPGVIGGLARILETTPEYLTLLSDDPEPAASWSRTADLSLSAEAIEAARLIDTLPFPKRVVMLSAIMTLVRAVGLPQQQN